MGAGSIQVSPLTRYIGAEVSGIDLRQPVDQEVFAQIEEALMDYGVLFFREQDLTDNQQIKFASLFAPVNRSAFARTDANGDAGFIEWLDDSPENPPKADLWHTDVAFRPEPPVYAVLNCREAPATGGDTLWVSLYALYEALSPAMQAGLDRLELEVHPAVAEVRGDDRHKRVVYRPDPAQAGCTQPLVRVHPVTGKKALFLCGEYMSGIVGLHEDESRALLGLLRSRLNDPSLQCRWHWQKFDLVIWDERCTNHRALSDHYPEHRLMRRCTAGTERPLAASRPEPGGVS